MLTAPAVPGRRRREMGFPSAAMTPTSPPSVPRPTHTAPSALARLHTQAPRHGHAPRLAAHALRQGPAAPPSITSPLPAPPAHPTSPSWTLPLITRTVIPSPANPYPKDRDRQLKSHCSNSSNDNATSLATTTNPRAHPCRAPQPPHRALLAPSRRHLLAGIRDASWDAPATCTASGATPRP